MIYRFLLLAFVAAALPAVANAHWFPFYVTNNTSREFCVTLSGPSGREYTSAGIPPGTQNYNFYNTWDWLTSSAGEWQVVLYPLHANTGACDPRLGGALSSPPVVFCFDPYTSAQDVHITVRNLSSPSVDKPGRPCTGEAAVAMLGDGPPRLTDQDHFHFDATAGERVTLRVEPDGAMGHLGSTATLALRGPDGTVLERRTGTPPMEVAVSLPVAGDYEVEVAEPAGQGADAYRGPYRLRLLRAEPVSVPGQPGPGLRPQRNVEH